MSRPQTIIPIFDKLNYTKRHQSQSSRKIVDKWSRQRYSNKIKNNLVTINHELYLYT
jgi:hypothetical protein